MTKFYKNILRAFMAISCLYAPHIMGDGLAGSPATILVEATKTVMSVSETNNIYVTVNNPTGSSISGIVVAVTVPPDCTIGSVTVPSGTTYSSGTWTFTSSLAANASKTLIIPFTYTGSSGVIITPSATFTQSSTGTSSINILIGCPLLKWSTTGNVRINGGSIVQFNDANTTYTENLAAQGVDAVFSGFRKNVNPPEGYPQYTARFQTLSITNLGPVLQFNNANPQSNPSGNNPYQIVDPATGVVNPAQVTDNPPNYLEGVFTFDATTYPSGVNGLSFFIYDIDADPTPGWQDAVIVFGTDINNNEVAPLTERSAITTVYDINAMIYPTTVPYTINIGGMGGLVNYNGDNPRGRVTYLFPSAVRSITIRYFRNSQINSEHYVWLSNLYRGCGTDLQLRLDIPETLDCESLVTYTLTAHNEGPSDVGLAQTTGIVPTGITVLSSSASAGTFDPIAGTWTLSPLLVGETETLVVNAQVTQSSVYFDMELLGDGDQTVPGDNIATATLTAHYIVVRDDSAATGAGMPVLIDWLANDTSIGGTILAETFSVLSSPDGTVVTTTTPGVIQFTPNEGFSGTAHIEYQVCDSNECCNTATISVTVSAGPILVDDYADTNPNTLVNIPVLANDHPGGGSFDLSTLQVTSGPAHGTTNVLEDGTIDYTPDTDFCGSDTFVYFICNTIDLCDSASVFVTVHCPPTAVDDYDSTNQNTPVTTAVLANDSPGSGSFNLASLTVTSAPSHGETTVNPDGTITYTPETDFCGTDTYVYNICNTFSLCDSASVFITVHCPPTAVDDYDTTNPNTPVTTAVLANDSPGSGSFNLNSLAVTSGPSHGATLVNPDGTITYTPAMDFCGTDTYVYNICNTFDLCASASVFITVYCPPNAVDDTASTNPNTMVNIPVLANDSPGSGSFNLASLTVTDGPAHGTTAVQPDGTINYMPTTDFCGTDTFVYNICNTFDLCSSAHVYVTVHCPPTAVNDFDTTNQNTPVTVPVLANDSPGSGSFNLESLMVTSGPSHGTTTVNPDGTINYNPDTDFCGTDTFTYNICNTFDLCSSASVFINVRCVGRPPIAINDAATTPINTPVDIDVKSNDLIGSTPLVPSSVVVITPATHGSTSVNPVNGVVTYTPNTGFVGTDSFVYKICDMNDNCSSATVYITVVNPNAPCPTASNCCTGCFDSVNEAMNSAASFAQFIPITGSWSQIANYVTTTAGSNSYNFLKYVNPVNQTHEVLQVQLRFPEGQLYEQFVSAGLISHWDGNTPTTGQPSIVCITFDNRTGTPVNPRLTIQSYNNNSDLVAFNIPFAINLGQTYTLSIVKNFGQTDVYIDNTFIGTSPSSGTGIGNYIGVWAFQATTNFMNFKSCSYKSTPPVNRLGLVC